MINQQTFTAPNEKLEIAIIEYGINTLKIPFGEFWYKWFDSHRNKENNNSTLHFECNDGTLLEKIKETFPMIEELNFLKFHEIKVISLSEWNDFKFQYFIHFKTKK